MKLIETIDGDCIEIGSFLDSEGHLRLTIVCDPMSLGTGKISTWLPADQVRKLRDHLSKLLESQ